VITFSMHDGTDVGNPEQERQQLTAPATRAARAPNLDQLTLHLETYAFNTGSQFVPPDATPYPQWPRENKRVALVIVVLIHIALLTAVLLSRTRQPAPPKTRSINVALFQEKVPEEKIPKPADTKTFDLPPPRCPRPKSPRCRCSMSCPTPWHRPGCSSNLSARTPLRIPPDARHHRGRAADAPVLNFSMAAALLKHSMAAGCNLVRGGALAVRR
jgi:hypothetical protein